MYFQTSYMFMPGLQYYDARRLLELQQQYSHIMEKHQRVYAVDPFEPIRRLAMSEAQAARHPDKPLTSFRISDILSADREKCRAKSENNIETSPVDYRSNLHEQHKDRSCPKRLRVENLNLNNKHDDNARDELSPRTIVRPWSSSPRSSSEKSEKPNRSFSLNDTKHSFSDRSLSPEGNSNSANSISSEESRKLDSASRLKQSLKRCHSAGRYEGESEDEEIEIDVEGCGEDSDTSVVHTDKGDISPLDALVAMSSKTFMGLESFGKTYTLIHCHLRISLTNNLHKYL